MSKELKNKTDILRKLIIRAKKEAENTKGRN